MLPVKQRQARLGRSRHSPEVVRQGLRRYLAVDLLIRDDFGLQPFTQTQAEDLYEIVSERNLKASTIVTSNRPIQGWLGLFPDPVLAQAVVDRLCHNI